MMKPKWRKKLNVYKFSERVPCPYCDETFPSNLSLSRHVLKDHNWNKDEATIGWILGHSDEFAEKEVKI